MAVLISPLDVALHSVASRFDGVLSELESVRGSVEKMLRQAKYKRLERHVEALKDVANEVGKSFSGSWLGYHSRVYYENLESPPPGCRFDPDWGAQERWRGGTVGNWMEYDLEWLLTHIHEQAGTDQDVIKEAASDLFDAVIEAKEEVLSCLTTVPGGCDDFLKRVSSEVEKVKKLSIQGFIEFFQPKGHFITHDHVALSEGHKAPAHIIALAQASSCAAAFKAGNDVIKLANRATQHMKRISTSTLHPKSQGSRIFIGHGRSPIWKELRDFLRDRLGLEWDEFNRVPTAGVNTQARLEQMLDSAAFAFLVMTPEDEQSGGELRARENVVHEAGLFQGRLGFKKAIILREEGCEAFSNTAGLTELRFSQARIGEIFEEIRRVLEREEVIAGHSSK